MTHCCYRAHRQASGRLDRAVRLVAKFAAFPSQSSRPLLASGTDRGLLAGWRVSFPATQRLCSSQLQDQGGSQTPRSRPGNWPSAIVQLELNAYASCQDRPEKDHLSHTQVIGIELSKGGLEDQKRQTLQHQSLPPLHSGLMDGHSSLPERVICSYFPPFSQITRSWQASTMPGRDEQG